MKVPPISVTVTKHGSSESTMLYIRARFTSLDVIEMLVASGFTTAEHREAELRVSGAEAPFGPHVCLGSLPGLGDKKFTLELQEVVQPLWPEGWAPARPQDHSLHSQRKIEDVHIRNDTEQPLSIFWVSHSGELVQYGGQQPGGLWRGCTSTYATHVWLLWPADQEAPDVSSPLALGLLTFEDAGTTVNASEVQAWHRFAMKHGMPTTKRFTRS